MNAAKLLSFRSLIPNSVFSLTNLRTSYFPLYNVFSVVNSKNFSSFNNLNKFTKNLNLTPPSPLLIPSCGFKIKRKLQRRCKDCYLTRVDGTVMILCDSYPRHKQILRTVRKEKYTWILSHCCQSKFRPY